MKLFLTRLALFSLMLSATILHAQERNLKRANSKFDQYAFIDSQKLYLKVIESGYHSADLYSRLGDAYYFNANYEDAARWYKNLEEQYPQEINTDHYFRYAQSLRAIKQYDDSQKILAIYNNKIRLEKGEEYVISQNEDYAPASYEIDKLLINAKGYSDFAPSYYGEKMLFASARDTGGLSKRRHKWNDQPFLDLYESDSVSVTKMRGGINTKYHESTAVNTADGNTLYFTRNNFTKGDYAKDKKGINRLKIYRSKKDSNDKWSKAEELSINSDEFTTAHPALSPDGKTLYFASDREGTLGSSDLWKVNLEEDGTLGTPVNLGGLINTSGRETFPFVASNGDLYFSSDGRFGLGGLDIYVRPINSEVVYALEKPINSSKDDFTFIINEIENTGYFASNRNNNPLDDDIYSFKRKSCEASVSIIVQDEKGNNLEASEITFIDLDNKLIKKAVLGATAYAFEEAICGTSYRVRGEKEGFATSEKQFTIPVKSDVQTIVLTLKETVTKLVPGKDIGKLLNPIVFDFDKSKILAPAKIELAKVIELMKQYPNLRIDVRSHTDSRGNGGYNLKLSERRNKETIDYIVQQGISRDRLSGRGYGEQMLLNDCGNISNCSEEDYQLNRRSEFIIVNKEE